MNPTLSMYPAHFAVLFLRLWKYLDRSSNPDELDEKAKKHWNLWVLPQVVDCIIPEWHGELSQDQQQEVKKRQVSFLDIARRVDQTQNPTTEDLRQARDNLLAIYRIVPTFMAGWLRTNALKAIDTALNQTTANRNVIGYDFKAGDDWSGEPAVWVWLIVEDSTVTTPSWQSDWATMQDDLFKAIDTKFEGRLLLYPHVRTVSEQNELLAGDWE